MLAIGDELGTEVSELSHEVRKGRVKSRHRRVVTYLGQYVTNGWNQL
jgi:hypothetical protein